MPFLIGNSQMSRNSKMLHWYHSKVNQFESNSINIETFRPEQF